VYWYRLRGASGLDSYFDVYHNIWDYDEAYFDEETGSFNGCLCRFYTFDYLKSLMAVDGLRDCDYRFRDIRSKGVVYPSAFLWQDMERDNPGEYRVQVTDKGITELIKEYEDGINDFNSFFDALEMIRNGKCTSDKAAERTNLKNWQSHKLWEIMNNV
jgi:hypothetical protein